MSAIYGLIQLDGRPAEAADLAAIGAACAQFGPDEDGRVIDGAAALGRLLLRGAPEDRHDPMPYRGDDLLFTAAARLDNRDVICADLAIPPTERAGLADSALLLRAYRRWGAACVERLRGDWALAAWHPREGRLFLARDQFGITGLCYTYDGRRLAFAPTLPGLLALPGIDRRIDEPALADLLVTNPGDPGHTLYAELRRLPPASTLQLQIGGAPQLRRYWRMEDAPAVRMPDDDAYVGAFLERYEAAVAARLRAERPVGVTLSAGFDSGSVAALAAQGLRADGRGLTALTSRPRFLPQGFEGPRAMPDEWEQARRHAAQIGVAEHLAVGAAPIGVVESIGWLLRQTGAPSMAGGNLPWLIDLLQTAQRHGIGVLLTGQGGNAAVSWHGGIYQAYVQLRAGRLRAGAALLRRWRGDTGHSWARVLAAQIVKPLALDLRALAGAYPAPGREPWRALTPISPAFARRIGLNARMRAAPLSHHTSAIRDDRTAQLALLQPQTSPLGPIWHAMGAAFGITVRDPTCDTELISFCLGLPPEQFRRGSRSRLLIRRAMAGRLPAETVEGTRRGIQAADLALRILDDRAEVAALIDRITAHPSCGDYLDLGAIRRSWEQLQREPGGGRGLLNAAFLLRGLHAGAWLTRL